VKLVDTSSWIEYLRQLQSPTTLRVANLLLDGNAAWCDMTAVELWNGVRGVKEKKNLNDLENEITLLPVNAAVWQVARKLATRCHDTGMTFPASDIIISACAKFHGVDVEHCDKHFDQILPLAKSL
jgi:predicted nucleic acid-binding protein